MMNFLKLIQNTNQPNSDALQSLPEDQQLHESQQQIIKVLKEEIIRLQATNDRCEKHSNTLEKENLHLKRQIESLKEKITVLTENNESLLHTFQVFQKEFVKRNKRDSVLPLATDISNQINGPFHLEIVRTVKSTITNNFIKPVTAEEKSEFSTHYSYFFQENSVEEEEVQMFNQLVTSDKAIRVSKVKSLGKKSFFNERFRHIFWLKAIENKLKITEKFYGVIEASLQENAQNRPPKTSIIDLDIRRMDFRIEDEKSSALKVQLKKLLEMFEVYRPDIGYVQGMSYFGWMFVIRMSPFHSFVSFANVMLTDPFVSGLYSFSQKHIKRVVSFFEECLEDKKPKLAKYAKMMGVDSELFIIEWAYTFYTRTFSLKIVSKIWDLWLSEGYNVFFKVAMTIFDMLEGDLLALALDESDKYIEILRNNTFQFDEAQFLRTLSKQKLFQDLKLE